jgi:hypothetical protein
MAAFLAAHDALFDPIDALYDRAALAFPLLTGPGCDAVQTFIDTRHAAGPMVSVGYGAFDLWQSSPGDSVLHGAAKAFFTGLAERVREVSTGFAMALPVLDGRPVPGGIVVRSVGEPDAEAVTGGTPFTLTFRLANPGDTPVAAADAELGCGDGLALDRDASQSVPALAAGAEVLLAWSVRATPNGPGGFTGHCQLLVMRGGEVLTRWDEPILEYVPEE